LTFVARATVAITGELDFMRLERILAELVEHHEVFRTAIVPMHGLTLPVQVVNTRETFMLPHWDLGELSPEDGSREMAEINSAHCLAVADPAKPPLFRCGLISIGETSYTLLLVLSAFCGDFRTFKNIFAFIRDRYKAEVVKAGGAGTLPELLYIDYSEWSNQLANMPEAAPGFSYWRAAFDASALSLPGRMNSTNGNHFCFDSVHSPMPSGLIDAPGSTAETAENIFLTLWCSFVFRLDGSQSSVGIFMDGRREDQSAGAMGLFGRFCPFLPDFGNLEKFSDHLRLVCDLVETHRDWQDCFQWNDRPKVSWFPFCFELREHDCLFAGERVRMEMRVDEVCLEPFNLKLLVHRKPGGFFMEFVFRRGIFERLEVETLAAGFLDFCRGALQNDLCVFDPEPTGLARYCLKGVLLPKPESIPYVHHLFEKWARTTPDSPCLVYRGRSLSFGEVNGRANGVRQQLRALNLTGDDTVGVCIEVQPETIIALLGILKAGAAYVPLDPRAPIERTRKLFRTAGVKTVVTSRELAERFSDFRTVLVSESGHFISMDVPDGLAARNLAYVLFTSGSTGTPKPVLIEHEQLSSYVRAIAKAIPVEPGFHSAFLSSLAADLGNTSLFGALCNGGCLHLIPQDFAADGKWLADYFRSNAIDLLKIVPSHFRALLQGTDEPQALFPLRALVFGGERLDCGLVETLEKLQPPCQLFNHYGPTETTVGVTTTPFSPDQWRRDAASIPIGYPLAHVAIQLIDRFLYPLPAGFCGEICVAGPQIARGYLGQLEATAEKFIPDFFSGASGQRAYRTGDLGRFERDGGIVWLGRRDDEIKIRGYRVHPGEIGLQLEQHPDVQRVFVLPIELEDGDCCLAAFVIPRVASRQLGVKEVREYLEPLLPEHMIPSRVVVLKSFPLTENGKMDRTELRRLALVLALGNEASGLVFRTVFQEVLGSIWRDVLKVKIESVEDNFFELGGHSLLATQVVSRIRQVFGVDLSLRSIFEAPTLRGLAEKVEQGRKTGTEGPRLERRCTKGEAPLSFAQERLWFIHRLETGSRAYHITGRVAWPRVQVDVLARVLNEITKRHEVLRTHFEFRGDQSVQVIEPPEWQPLPVVDLAAVEQSRQKLEQRRIAEEELGFALDLERGPVMRTILVKGYQEEYELLYALHHIASDGWSMGILNREIGLLYEAFSKGLPSPLTELPVQYADYAAWQREYLQGQRLKDLLNYWKEELKDVASALEMPTDFPRVGLPSYAGASEPLRLCSGTFGKLKEISVREGASLFMVLLAGFKILLQRYTGQMEVLVGTSVANRNRMETEGLIGFFVNLLALRTDFKGDPNFFELLEQERHGCVGAYEHQDLPFEKLVEELQPERDLSRSPLFQALMEFIGGGRGNGANDGRRASRLMAKFDLRLVWLEQGEELVGELEYREDLFEKATVQRMARHLEKVLESAVRQPSQRVRELEMLGESERELLLHKWNHTSRNFGKPRWVHEKFEEQAKLNPDAVAVEYNERRISYGELNRRASRLATHLSEFGVGPEVLVGIFLKRSVEWVVSLLGVLKTGAAYVPVDASQPLERIDRILRDGGVNVVVTDGAMAEKLPWGERLVVNLDQLETANEVLILESSREVEGGNLAYVIYTSGSTGQPKGVMITHGGLSNYLNWCVEKYELNRGDGAIVHTSIGFDLTITGLFGPLVAGQKIVLVPEGEGIESLVHAYQQDRQYSLVKITPAHLELLSHEINAGQAERTRLFVIGGEALAAESLGFWRRHGGMRLVNEYGPTETVVGCCTHEVGREDRWTGAVPIGRPISNTRLYILSSALEPVPVKVAGQLHIGGAGVGRGYLNQPNWTAEKYVPDEFGREAGMRLYRSGDKARYLEDGRIEYIGREDQQVKLRGYRIELGEVEYLLRQHPSVKESVVVLREEPDGDKRLVGYVVADGALVQNGQLREYLKNKLPEYMIPAVLVSMKQLPLTNNGKVDHGKLPLPDNVREGGAGGGGPRTAEDELMAQIWGGLLKQGDVGREENFFDLGGHSLLATQVISRVGECFGVWLPLRSIFENPTLAGFVGRVKEARRKERGLAMTPLVKACGGPPWPLSFGQERLWFIDQLQPGNVAYLLPGSVRITVPLDVEAFETAISEITRRHEILRTRLVSGKNGPLQVIDAASRQQLEIIDLSGLEESSQRWQVNDLERMANQSPFDLARGPLLRWQLVRLSPADHLLMYTLHHIITDQWSTEILGREIYRLYEDYHNGGTSSLPELPIQYRDYAFWQRQWLAGNECTAQIDYWKQQLAGLSPAPLLPGDYPNASIQSFAGKVRTETLATDLAGGLQLLNQQEKTTTFMTMLAALKILLHRVSGRLDIPVGTDIANRNRVETEDLIGFFVNHVVLRTDLSGDPTFREMLARVRRVALQAYDYQEVPFDKVVETLRPERSNNHTPLFQVLFVLNRRDFASRSLSPHFEVDQDRAKFDLSIFITESRQEIVMSWNYKTKLFRPATIERLSREYAELLRRIIEKPDARLSELKLLTRRERAGRSLEAAARQPKAAQRRAVNLARTKAGENPDPEVRPGPLLSDCVTEGSTVEIPVINDKDTQEFH
jgi:amino acid adenylation domain-containing protein